MPCNDSSSQIVVTLSDNDTLIDYEYEKIQCGKSVTYRDSYKKQCIGKTVDDLCKVSFESVRSFFKTVNTEEEFLLYLEWKAVNEVLRQYSGKSSPDMEKRYQISSISSEENFTVITMVISPPDDMPAILRCRPFQHRGLADSD